MGLLELPDELLLMVVSHFTLIQPFDHVDPYDDVCQRYQEENDRRTKDLAALSLTSKRLNHFITPMLYSTIMTYNGHGRYERLLGIFRTLIVRPERRKLIKSIHNSPFGYGNLTNADRRMPQQFEQAWTHYWLPLLLKVATGIWKDKSRALGIWLEMKGGRYLHQGILALIIAMAVNVEKLAIVVSKDGMPIVELFNHCTATPTVKTFKFRRLRSLVLSHMRPGITVTPTQVLIPAGTYPHLKQLQLLGRIRLAEPETDDEQLRGDSSHPWNCKLRLENAHLWNSNYLGPVASHISRCTTLVRLNIYWLDIQGQQGLIEFYNALSIHKDTLKSLTMEMGYCVYSRVVIPEDLSNPLPSLASFTALRTLRIPSMMLLTCPRPNVLLPMALDNWWAMYHGFGRISSRIPPTLEKLEISENFPLGTSMPVLHDLAHDKPWLPGLSSVELRSVRQRNVRECEEAFARYGVLFRAVWLQSL